MPKNKNKNKNKTIGVVPAPISLREEKKHIPAAAQVVEQNRHPKEKKKKRKKKKKIARAPVFPREEIQASTAAGDIDRYYHEFKGYEVDSSRVLAAVDIEKIQTTYKKAVTAFEDDRLDEAKEGFKQVLSQINGKQRSEKETFYYAMTETYLGNLYKRFLEDFESHSIRWNVFCSQELNFFMNAKDAFSEFTEGMKSSFFATRTDYLFYLGFVEKSCAELYIARGVIEKGLEHYRAALKHYHKNATFFRDFLAISNVMGALYRSQRDAASAVAFFNNASDLLRKKKSSYFVDEKPDPEQNPFWFGNSDDRSLCFNSLMNSALLSYGLFWTRNNEKHLHIAVNNLLFAKDLLDSSDIQDDLRSYAVNVNLTLGFILLVRMYLAERTASAGLALDDTRLLSRDPFNITLAYLGFNVTNIVDYSAMAAQALQKGYELLSPTDRKPAIFKIMQIKESEDVVSSLREKRESSLLFQMQRHFSEVKHGNPSHFTFFSPFRNPESPELKENKSPKRSPSPLTPPSSLTARRISTISI